MIPKQRIDDAGPAQVELSTLDAIAAGCPADDAWFTADERSRVASIGATLRRRQFVAGHWLARRLGARALAVEVSRLGMDRDDVGRPRLLLDGAPAALYVSLTHSDEQVACAVAAHPIGIDLEVPRRARDLAALARFTFSAREAERLDAVAAGDRVVEFYRLWALKEARGKRCGEGVLPRRARRFTAEPAGADAADGVSWTFGDVTLAVVGDRAGRIAAAGLPETASIAYWRFVEGPCDADPATRDDTTVR